MLKCPNCGSTAQPKVYETAFVEDGWTITKYTTYECGCGHFFTTQIYYISDGYEEVEEGG